MSAMARGALASSAILVLLSLLEAAYAHYTPTWAVHVPAGKESADAVAMDHGFVNLGEVRIKLTIITSRLTKVVSLDVKISF